MCFDRNINENKDGKILEVLLVSCVMVRETHFKNKKNGNNAMFGLLSSKLKKNVNLPHTDCESVIICLQYFKIFLVFAENLLLEFPQKFLIICGE